MRGSGKRGGKRKTFGARGSRGKYWFDSRSFDEADKEVDAKRNAYLSYRRSSRVGTPEEHNRRIDRQIEEEMEKFLRELYP